MPHAIRLNQTGGPEALTWEEVAVGDPGSGEVRIRHTSVGLNYIDTYHRTGLYPLPLPSGIGLEAAGVIEAVGPGVTHLQPGDRVAYGTGPIGAYAEARVMPAEKLVRIPEGVSDETAAAMMLQGMTVEYLLHRSYPVGPESAVLFHAAAGGVGLIACQWARSLGCTLIGTAGSPEKAALAKAHGADHVILYRERDWVAEVRDLTGGKGVDVVYDSVGRDTFLKSLDCLKPRGMMVTFGQASGPIPPIDLGILSQKGSLFLTRPTLMSYTSSRADLELSAGRLFKKVASGLVTIQIGQRFALKDAAEAHRALEGRATTGSTVLVP